MRVPDGLYAMMPERDGAYLEQHAPWVFGEAPKQDVEDYVLPLPAPIEYEGPWRRSNLCSTVNGRQACVSVAVLILATGRKSSPGT
jgi:hypothetical protein